MKKSYKEFMMSYLDSLPEDATIKSNPRGWGGTTLSVNGNVLKDSNRHWELLNGEMLELPVLQKYIKKALPENCVSYEFKYDRTKKKLVGTYKIGKKNSFSLPVVADVPKELWFDDLEYRIDVDGKRTYTVMLTPNIKNGFTLENDFDKHLEALRLNIRESLYGSLHSRSGRVKGWIRGKLNYSERLSIYIGIETLEYHVFKKTITVK
jgi:hypothetical protein